MPIRIVLITLETRRHNADYGILGTRIANTTTEILGRGTTITLEKLDSNDDYEATNQKDSGNSRNTR